MATGTSLDLASMGIKCTERSLKLYGGSCNNGVKGPDPLEKPNSRTATVLLLVSPFHLDSNF